MIRPMRSLARAAPIAVLVVAAAVPASRQPGRTSPELDRSSVAAAARAQAERPSAYIPLALAGIAIATSPPPTATRTPWLPPTADALCATPTMPGATATALPTVTPHPTTRYGRPPELRLVTASTTVTAVIGTYCWGGLCSDTFAYMTPHEPAIIRSPFSARLVLAAEEAPFSLSLSVHDVTGIEPYHRYRERTAWRATGPATGYVLVPQREQEITIARRPGRYVVHASAWWNGDGVIAPRGDVSYGFLIEVQP